MRAKKHHWRVFIDAQHIYIRTVLDPPDPHELYVWWQFAEYILPRDNVLLCRAVCALLATRTGAGSLGHATPTASESAAAMAHTRSWSEHRRDGGGDFVKRRRTTIFFKSQCFEDNIIYKR